MRGPGYKLTGDVRRTWRCPTCGRERKLLGDVTSLACGCNEGTWMRIVAERIIVPRPIQRPSDVERRPIDFGIEPLPPAPPKTEATIVKSAISHEPEPVQEIDQTETAAEIAAPIIETLQPGDDWGDGIL